MKTLKSLMQAQQKKGAVLIDHASGMTGEFLDNQTGLIWMSVESMTQHEFGNFEVDNQLTPVGVAPGAMDMAIFHYSPNGEGKPVLERTINGRRFINAASAEMVSTPSHPGGMAEISVNKSHSLGFAAGRKLNVLSLPEGDFIEVVGTQAADEQLRLPVGATLKTITLKQPWIVKLPTPARTLWWIEHLRSFQGPVSLPTNS